VRLLTVHAAKGLEFRHVLLIDGGWQARADLEEERRLYYVGMTRARETLDLFLRDDERNPFAPTLGGEVLEIETPAAPPDAAVLARRFEILGLQDLFLSWAGRFPASDPVHRRLAALAAGATLTLDDSGQLLDRQQEPVAVLSNEGRTRWTLRRDHIEEIRVVAMLRRDADSVAESFRREVLAERWELPLVEVRYSESSNSMSSVR